MGVGVGGRRGGGGGGTEEEGRELARGSLAVLHQELDEFQNLLNECSVHLAIKIHDYGSNLPETFNDLFQCGLFIQIQPQKS